MGIFWRAFELKIFVYVMAIWNIWQTFGISYSYLFHFVVTRYILSHFGMFGTKINLATLAAGRHMVLIG
jgi:hypothetical protein